MLQRITTAVVSFVRRLVRRAAAVRAIVTTREVATFLRQNYPSPEQRRILQWAHRSGLRIEEIDLDVLKALHELGPCGRELGLGAWREVWLEIEDQERHERKRLEEKRRRSVIEANKIIQERNHNVLRSPYDRDDDPRAALARAIYGKKS